MSDPRDDLAALIFDKSGLGEWSATRLADAILEAGWRNFAVYRTEPERDVNTVIARSNGGKPTCIVGERICYWTGTECRWAE